MNNTLREQTSEATKKCAKENPNIFKIITLTPYTLCDLREKLQEEKTKNCGQQKNSAPTQVGAEFFSNFFSKLFRASQTPCLI